MLGKLRIIVLCCLALVGGVAYERACVTDVTQLSFLAVGQGDCAVVQSEGRTVLIDVGPKTDTFDAGERIVFPELNRLGVGVIDLVLLSHPDIDHIGGLVAVCRRFKVGKVGIPACFERDEVLKEQLQRANINKDQVIWLSGRHRTRLGAFDIRIDCVEGTGPASDNDGSMFVRLSAGSRTACFSGDASISAEVEMMRRKGPWNCQLLKAGHHGSRTSTGTSWLQLTAPEYVILCCGRGNRYGHPTSEALQRIDESGARALRTDRQGTITFIPSSGGSGWNLK